MQKIAGTKTIRLAASLLVFGVVLGCVVASLAGPALARTDGIVPVPPRKPAATPAPIPAAAGEEGRRVSDIARALLNFGVAPAPSPPKPKPAAAPVKALSQEPVKEAVLKPVEYPDRPLSGSDSGLYKSIFELQEEGKITQADPLIKKLVDQRLMGHVLYQRYMHPTAYKSTFGELRDWLVLYGDHPGAGKIYKMASSRVPEDYTGKLAKPVTGEIIGPRHEPTMYAGKNYVSNRKRSADEIKSVEKTRNSILTLANNFKPTAALAKLQASEQMFDTVEYDSLRAKIASSYLYSGKTETAAKLAAASLKRSGEKTPLAGWVAGLAAWQNGDYSESAKSFEVTSRSSYATGWTSASASYWAARAHMRSGNVRAVSGGLEEAMKHPRTFYGLIATRSLGRDFDFNWDVPTFTRESYDMLMKTHAGNRAIALVASGQTQRAESELLRMKPETDGMRDALLAYAGYAALPSLGMRLASMVSDGDGGYYDFALYPTGPWKPEDGYKIDPALIYAIMRQESRFDPSAESARGAVGLMQVMPATAISIDDGSTLTNPQQNLEIGQRYIENLLKDKNVKGDMVMLLVAYNAGPGNLAKWKKQWPGVKDPLMFIELIPSAETRSYVERVLANFWIYRLKNGQPTPTLDALATGKSAKYAAVGSEIPTDYSLASSH